MAKNKVDILLGLNNAELRAKLKESQGLLQGFKTSLGGILGGAALGVSMKSLGDYALNSAKAFEQASISFNVLLGSEERAAKLVNDIQDLANVTPMTSSGLQENAKLLLNFNAVAEDEIIPTLRMLGDITGGDQVKMDSMTLAFAQCASAGRLMGQDLLQMVNAGFNPLQIISEKTGKSLADLKEEMSEGKISVDMVKQAFKDATSEGGRFYGMMEAQSQSKAGLEATRADSFEILGRTIAERALPALKEFDQAQIDAANSATEYVKTLYDWMDVNNQTLNAVKNTSIALLSAVTAFTATKKGAEIATAAIEYFRYQQALARTETTALALAMQGKLVLATRALIAQFRTLTATMLANPWTWVAVAIAGVTAAVVSLKNESEKTAAIIEDLNNTQDQQVSTLNDAINTIKELSGAENLNYEEKQRLTKAIDLLVEQYPKYADQLREELALKGEINKATAEQIANELTLQKVKELEKRRDKVAKVINNRGNYATYESFDGTTHFAYEDEKTKEYNKLSKEISNAYDSRQSIINTLTGVSSKTPPRTQRSAASSTSKEDKKAAEKAQKEALALKLAQLDAEILLVKNNADEVYKLELQKIQAKLNAEKQGTSAYQNILNERTQLEQQHQEQAIQLEIERYNRKAELDQLDIEKQKSLLEAQKEEGSISNSDYYAQLQAFEDQKYNITLNGLIKQEQLYQNDLAKLEQINQEKLVLTANYEIAKQELVAESLEAENERWRNTLEHLGESFQDSLSEFFQGNQSLKESFISIFGDIKAAFARMIAEMLVEQAKLKLMQGLTTLAGAGGWLGTAAGFIKGFFADGGIVPGNYNQAVPIVAHGSEMVLNPLQQKTLWNMIAGANNTQTAGNNMAQGQNQQVIVNNITPVFQSLDPAQGQKMFTEWMKTSGVPIVKDSIKNNNHQMRDMIKGV